MKMKFKPYKLGTVWIRMLWNCKILCGSSALLNVMTEFCLCFQKCTGNWGQSCLCNSLTKSRHPCSYISCPWTWFPKTLKFFELSEWMTAPFGPYICFTYTTSDLHLIQSNLLSLLDIESVNMLKWPSQNTKTTTLIREASVGIISFTLTMSKLSLSWFISS
jgi:hypothetical protein